MSWTHKPEKRAASKAARVAGGKALEEDIRYISADTHPIFKNCIFSPSIEVIKELAQDAVDPPAATKQGRE